MKTNTKKIIKRTSLFILSIALSSSALATASSPNDCLTGEVDFFNYERRVLSEVQKPGDKHSDRQYKNVAESLEQDFIAADAIFENDLYQMISDSHWSIYAQFCKPGLESICTGFLYDNQAIMAQPPLVAAVSVSNLLRASAKVPDADRAKLHRQLLDLNQTLSKERKLLKKVVQEALDRIPVLMKRMGMVFT